jgi:hypothetical protein
MFLNRARLPAVDDAEAVDRADGFGFALRVVALFVTVVGTVVGLGLIVLWNPQPGGARLAGVVGGCVVVGSAVMGAGMAWAGYVLATLAALWRRLSS